MTDVQTPDLGPEHEYPMPAAWGDPRSTRPPVMTAPGAPRREAEPSEPEAGL